MPKGWLIEMSGMPEICLDNLNIIKCLNEGPVGMRWEDEKQSNIFSKLLTESIARTNELYR
jgi:hypothetical protein